MKASYGEVTLQRGYWDKYNVKRKKKMKRKEKAVQMRNNASKDKEMRKISRH